MAILNDNTSAKGSHAYLRGQISLRRIHRRIHFWFSTEQEQKAGWPHVYTLNRGAVVIDVVSIVSAKVSSHQLWIIRHLVRYKVRNFQRSFMWPKSNLKRLISLIGWMSSTCSSLMPSSWGGLNGQQLLDFMELIKGRHGENCYHCQSALGHELVWHSRSRICYLIELLNLLTA